MTIAEIISGLKFTIEMFLFDPSTGEKLTEPRNNMDKITLDACKGAIKALGQQPCEDCISREAVLEILEKEEFKGDAIYEIEKKLPPVTPTRPTGKWIDIGDEGLVFKCSLCGNKNTIESKYCPNCGARMQEEEA